jgi:hypothetical protein
MTETNYTCDQKQHGKDINAVTFCCLLSCFCIHTQGKGDVRYIRLRLRIAKIGPKFLITTSWNFDSDVALTIIPWDLLKNCPNSGFERRPESLFCTSTSLNWRTNNQGIHSGAIKAMYSDETAILATQTVKLISF